MAGSEPPAPRRRLVPLVILAIAAVALVVAAALLKHDQLRRADPDRCPPPREGEEVRVELGSPGEPDLCKYTLEVDPYTETRMPQQPIR